MNRQQPQNGVHLPPQPPQPQLIGRVQIDMVLVPGNPVPQVNVSGQVAGGVAGIELMLGSARVLLHQQAARQQQGGVALAPAGLLADLDGGG